METSATKLPSRITIGLGVFLLALLLRFLGIGWGLPDATHNWSRHPDEPVIWAFSQQVKPAEGKFTPGFYNYGTFYLTLLRVSSDVVNAYSPTPDMGRYHLAGRVISAVAGALMAWLVVGFLWRRTHWIGALFGGLAVAFTPALVVHSRFQTVDVLAATLALAGLVLACGIAESAKPLKTAAWAGALIGLSASTKYTGVLALLAVAAVCWPGRRWRELAVSVGACVAAFVLTTPGCLLDSEKFWRDFAYEATHTSQGHGLVFAGTAPGFVYHFVNLSVGFGTLSLALGLFGLGRAAWRRHTWALALGIFFLATYLLIGRAEVKFMRYTFALIPVMAIGAGWIVGRAHEHPDRRHRGLVALGILGLGGLLGGGLASALDATRIMASNATDPRVTSLALLRAGENPSVGLVSDPWFYTPDLYPEAGGPRWVPPPQREEQMRASKGYQIVRGKGDWDMAVLDAKPNFVVFSSFETEGVDRLAVMATVPPEFQAQTQAFKAFIERLKREYDLVENPPFNPWDSIHDLRYIRPTIWVWKRKADLPSRSNGSSMPSSTSEGQVPTR